VQTTGFDPVHAPAWQVYVWSQAFDPVHVVPLATGVCVHVPPEHESVVQGLPSSQDPEQPPANEPNPSWHVIVAPEFMTT
jgi:hypothetical protein